MKSLFNKDLQDLWIESTISLLELKGLEMIIFLLHMTLPCADNNLLCLHDFKSISLCLILDNQITTDA